MERWLGNIAAARCVTGVLYAGVAVGALLTMACSECDLASYIYETRDVAQALRSYGMQVPSTILTNNLSATITLANGLSYAVTLNCDDPDNDQTNNNATYTPIELVSGTIVASTTPGCTDLGVETNHTILFDLNYDGVSAGLTGDILETSNFSTGGCTTLALGGQSFTDFIPTAGKKITYSTYTVPLTSTINLNAPNMRTSHEIFTGQISGIFNLSNYSRRITTQLPSPSQRIELTADSWVNLQGSNSSAANFTQYSELKTDTYNSNVLVSSSTRAADMFATNVSYALVEVSGEYVTLSSLPSTMSYSVDAEAGGQCSLSSYTENVLTLHAQLTHVGSSNQDVGYTEYKTLVSGAPECSGGALHSTITYVLPPVVRNGNHCPDGTVLMIGTSPSELSQIRNAMNTVKSCYSNYGFAQSAWLSQTVSNHVITP